MNCTLLAVACLIAVLSAVSWASMGWLLRMAPRASLRFAAANVLLVVGIFLVVRRTAEPNFLYFQGSDWLILAAMTLFRTGMYHLLKKAASVNWRSIAPNTPVV